MKYCIFTTPRSGSALLLHLMWPYLRNKFQYVENLNELQNMGYCWTDTGSRIEITPYDKDKTNFLNETIESEDEIGNRFEILKKYSHQNYLFKLFPRDLFPKEGWDFLLENYHFILLERKNTKEQLLSLFLASKTLVWNIDQKESEYSTYEFIEKDKIFFLQIFSRYKEMKELIIKNGASYSVVYHEDIISYSPIYKALEIFGFDDWKDYVNPDEEYLPLPMNSGDKRKYISNLEEFETWFDDYFSGP